MQEELPETEKLSVSEVITLNMIKKNIAKKDLDIEIVSKLLEKKLIEKEEKRMQYFIFFLKIIMNLQMKKQNTIIFKN